MSQSKPLKSWKVSLKGEVLARLTLPAQFGGNVDLAVEASWSADHTGIWRAVGDPAIEIPVDDEGALKNVSVVSCRPATTHNWTVTLEAKVRVRTETVVEAYTAREAKLAAEMESLPENWRVFSEHSEPGSEVLIGTTELLDSVHAGDVAPV